MFASLMTSLPFLLILQHMFLKHVLLPKEKHDCWQEQQRSCEHVFASLMTSLPYLFQNMFTTERKTRLLTGTKKIGWTRVCLFNDITSFSFLKRFTSERKTRLLTGTKKIVSTRVWFFNDVTYFSLTLLNKFLPFHPWDKV